MSRKKKEGKMPVKKGVSGVEYEPRFNGMVARTPSRRRPVIRDSWHPDAMPEEAYLHGDDEPALSPEKLHLAREISNARR